MEEAGICVSHKLAGEADAVGLGAPLRTTILKVLRS